MNFDGSPEEASRFIRHLYWRDFQKGIKKGERISLDPLRPKKNRKYRFKSAYTRNKFRQKISIAVKKKWAERKAKAAAEVLQTQIQINK